MSRNPSKEGWISFESDPLMRRTRGDIYGRCVPCLESLRSQLAQGKDEVELLHPLTCWKVTAVMGSLDECEALLMEYSSRYPNDFVYGKYGTGRPGTPTRVVVFHTQSVKERDLIRERLQVILSDMGREARIEVSRGCASIHGVLFGDWRGWKHRMRVEDMEKARKILDRLTKMLYLRGA